MCTYNNKTVLYRTTFKSGYVYTKAFASSLFLARRRASGPPTGHFPAPQPLALGGPDGRATKHDGRAQQDALGQAVAEEPDAEEEADELAHVKHDGDAEGGRFRAEEVDAADADVLREGVQGEEG